jgi:hypothetical protein
LPLPPSTCSTHHITRIPPQLATMRSAAKALQLAFQASREFASKAPKDRKVAVLGAAGGIGQPLSLLMKVTRRQKCGSHQHSSRT